MILVTGGAGFIGSNFILQWISQEKTPIINLDKLTYAGNLNNLAQVEHHSLYTFIQGDILNRALVHQILEKFKPIAIVHCAAETHVDRSLYHPQKFVETNVLGTTILLDEALKYWNHLPDDQQKQFRFLHLSTDEVFGSLAPNEPPVKEERSYAPNSPYSASKAASNHLVRSYHASFNLPTIITQSSNNFGPYQFPEKLIPLMITNALQGKPLPIYGDGMNIRNWIYVEDHCEALRTLLKKGTPGESYNIGDSQDHTNKEVVFEICSILDTLKEESIWLPHCTLIKHIKDRPAHDRRYGLDTSKIQKEIGWHPKGNFQKNLKKTVQWYLENLRWVENVTSGEYRDWVSMHYSETHA